MSYGGRRQVLRAERASTQRTTASKTNAIVRWRSDPVLGTKTRRSMDQQHNAKQLAASGNGMLECQNCEISNHQLPTPVGPWHGREI